VLGHAEGDAVEDFVGVGGDGEFGFRVIVGGHAEWCEGDDVLLRLK
jgi:hypothetical protein